jgi:O-antigen/teichoic acid export membrane protein
MKGKLINILHQKLGIDKAIAYTISTRSTQLLWALFTVYFTTKFLSPHEQGYAYTFGSILAIQVFFELGFTGIIAQFVAHEASHLKWTDGYQIEGEDHYKSRLSSLIHFAIKWYARLAGFLLVALVVSGIFFFQKYNDGSHDIAWKLPWILLVIGTSINFIIAPISSFLEGLGKVKEIAKIRFYEQVVSPMIYCGALALGFKLFVSSFMVLVSIGTFVTLVYKFSLHKYLLSIWKIPVIQRVSYMDEIFPFQWKIALSWISGYFIFQLFNPVLFASEGAKVAGQMGLTITALNSLLGLAYGWITTKVPTMSGLIAMKKYAQLDILFNKTLRQIMFVASAVVVSFILVVFVLQRYDISVFGSHIGTRFLPILPLAIFSFSIWLQVPINCWAVYLRTHKKEPLLLNSVLGGILSCVSALILGKYCGLYGLLFGFLSIQLTIGLIWVYIVFVKKKKEWHE